MTPENSSRCDVYINGQITALFFTFSALLFSYESSSQH